MDGESASYLLFIVSLRVTLFLFLFCVVCPLLSPSLSFCGNNHPLPVSVSAICSLSLLPLYLSYLAFMQQ